MPTVGSPRILLVDSVYGCTFAGIKVIIASRPGSTYKGNDAAIIKDYVTVQDVETVLDIYPQSAQELYDGIIAFEADELLALAQYAGVSVEQLIR